MDSVLYTHAHGWDFAVSVLNLACCSRPLWHGLDKLTVSTTHAVDISVLFVGGTVTRNNISFVDEAWEELSPPRALVAFGACTISGGPYWDSPSVLPGIVDRYSPVWPVAGCPPPSAAIEEVLSEIGRHYAHDSA